MTPGSTMDAKTGKVEAEAEEIEFKPLTAEEAQALRKKNPPVSPWWVILVQGVVGLGVALATWGLTGNRYAAWSAAYGALAVVVPAALFARGLASPLATRNPGSAMMGFFLWEAVKIALMVVMLMAAPRWVPNLSWLAMLVGMVLTMKVYWFVPALGKWRQGRARTNG